MRNKRLIRVIAVVLICYFVFQLILYTYIHRRQDGTPDDSEQLESSKEEKKRSISYSNILDFVTETHKHGIPLLLIDTAVLHRVISLTSSAVSQCIFFCNLHGTTVFGVQSQLWTHDISFLDALVAKGFMIHYQTVSDASVLEYLMLKQNTQTHYVIERSGHIIHLVILYSRPAGYWWHGHMEMIMTTYGDQSMSDVHSYMELKDLFTGEGAFNIPELIKVTMDDIKLRAPRYPKEFLDWVSQSSFIRCNQTRAKLFHALYGDPADDSEVFREAAKDTLHLVKKTLDYIDVRFWLSSGTCLGWFRQCDTIPYSGDVDIGIWIKDYNRHLIPALQDAGLTLKHLFGKESDSFELSFYYGDMKLDIFFFYEEEDYMWNGGTQVKTGNKYKYIFPKFSLCWTEFLDMKLRVPCDPETYIKANYGEKWFEPVKTWDWKNSPPNVQPNGRWPEEEWDKVILSFS